MHTAGQPGFGLCAGGYFSVAINLNLSGDKAGESTHLRKIVFYKKVHAHGIFCYYISSSFA